MKYKIGAFGSAEGNITAILPKAQELGRVLAKKKVIVITGATSGIPYEVSLAAYREGAELWGYSQATDFAQQKKQVPMCDNSIYTKLFYIPKGYQFVSDVDVCRKYRNVTSTASCDAGIIISGRWGTLNEFTNLYDMGKVIGILNDTEGIADLLPGLLNKINKVTNAKVFFDSSPDKLVDGILSELKKRGAV